MTYASPHAARRPPPVARRRRAASHARGLAQCTLVTDLTEQACAIGDLHHAIDAGVMSRDAVYAELGEVICGKKRGRTGDDQIIVFDSTGTGLQDAAAAAAVYRRALEQHTGIAFSLCD